MSDSSLVSAGDILAPSLGSHLLGHGTQPSADGAIVATLSGQVERVNKLIRVRPIHSRYTGEIGDIVVGRVVDIGDDRWRVDCGAKQLATLLLASIHLPGGVLRRRNAEDTFAIRQYFNTADLIVCEIQKTRNDGAINLHTRSERYGKLVNGQLVNVQPRLIRRCKQHFQTIDGVADIELILGVNGWLFVRATAADDVPVSVRERIVRVCNSALALNETGRVIYNATLAAVYHASLAMGLEAKAMRNPAVWQPLVAAAWSSVEFGTEGEET